MKAKLRRVEARGEGDVEAAVAGEERGVVAVQLRAARVEDVERHLGAVLGRAHDAVHHHVAGVHGRGAAQRRLLQLPVLGAVAVHGERLGVAAVEQEHVVTAQGHHAARGGDGRGGHHAQVLAVQAHHAHPRGAAELLHHVEAGGGGAEAGDGGLSLGDEDGGLVERRRGERNAQHLAARRVLARERVERTVLPEGRADELVFERREPRPGALRPAQVERVLAAVAVAQDGEHVRAILGRLELVVGDARGLLAQLVGVRVRRRAELVEVHLLEEVAVLGRALLAARVARVEEARAIPVPREAAARGAAVHPGHHLAGQHLAGGHVVDGDVTALRAILRHRHGHLLAVRRGDEEVDGGLSARVQLHRVHQHARRGGVLQRGQHHQHGLLPGRLELHREEDAALPHQGEVSR